MLFDHLDAFASSFSLMLVSEIGDKTFFIASLLTMQNPQNSITVFCGAYSALILMTLLSALVGSLVFHILSPSLTTILSSIGLIYFSIDLWWKLWSTRHNTEDEEEGELEQVEKELESIKIAQESAPSSSTPYINNHHNNNDKFSSPSPNISSQHFEHTNEENISLPIKRVTTPENKNKKTTQFPQMDWSLLWRDFATFRTQTIIYFSNTLRIVSPLFIQCFVLTFFGELGDKSQISTILLASSKSPLIIILGCILGHAVCTAIAVFLGKALSTQLNEKHLMCVSAIFFLIFGVLGFWQVYSENTIHNVANIVTLQ